MSTTTNLGLTLLDNGTVLDNDILNTNFRLLDEASANSGGGGGMSMCFCTSTTQLSGLETTVSGYASWTASCTGGATVSGNTITVPAGYSYALITLNFKAGDTNGWPGDPEVYLRKNGADIASWSVTHEDSKFYDIVLTQGTAIAAGDKIQVYGVANHDTTTYEEYGSAINFTNIQIFFIV